MSALVAILLLCGPGTASASFTVASTHVAPLMAAAVAPDGSVYTCTRDGVIKRNADLVEVFNVNLARPGPGGHVSGFTCTAIAVGADGSVVAVGQGPRNTLISLRNPIKATSDAVDYCGSIQFLCTDGIVLKLDAEGRLIFGTYIGVNGAIDEIHDVVVLSNGDVVIGGATRSRDFPVTPGALRETFHDVEPARANDGFLMRITARGNLAWSTFMGGPVDSLAVHTSGDLLAALVADHDKVPWPVPPGGRIYDQVAHLVRVTPDGAAVAWAALVPASVTYHATGTLAVDGFGNAYVGSVGDGARLTMFSSEGVRQWSTLLPNSDHARMFDVAVAPNGDLLITGDTTSFDFATDDPVPDLPRGSSSRSFLAVVTPRGAVRHISLYPSSRFSNGLPGGLPDSGVAVMPWTDGRILLASQIRSEGRLIVLAPPAAPPTPAVSVTPAMAAANGGSTIQISGGPFDEHTAVFVNGAPAWQVTRVHAALLEAIVPAGSGSASVTVITGAGGRTTAAGVLTYAGTPCTPALGDHSWRAPSSGASVEISSIGCDAVPWSSAPWLTVTAQANSTLLIQATPNPGSLREALVWRGTRAVHVAQGPGACTIDVQPAGLEVGPDAVTVPVTLAAGPGCRAYPLTSPPIWAGLNTATNTPDRQRLMIQANTTGHDRAFTWTFRASPNDGWPGAVVDRDVVIGQRGAQACTPGAAGSLTVSAEGGLFTTPVSAPAGCRWAAGTESSWLAVRAPAAGTGNETLTLHADANLLPQPRTGTVTLGRQAITVTQAAAACVYDVVADTVAVPARSSTHRVAVYAPTGCGITVSTSASWLVVSLEAALVGPDKDVVITAGGSREPTPREATIQVGSRTILVRQQADERCLPELSTRVAVLPTTASSTRVTVSHAGGCGISATSKDTWLTVTGDATGATIAATANPASTVRTGTVVIANRAVRVRQAGTAAGCGAALPFTTFAAITQASTFQLPVTAPPGCPWTATTTAPWVTLAGNTSGTGNGTVAITVSAFTDPPMDRTATVQVAGQVLTVRQGGGGHAVVASVPTSGGSASGFAFGPNLTASSADGRIVAFLSVAPLTGAAAGGFQVFVRDRDAATTTLVSRAPSGEPANGEANSLALSADGGHVAWSSLATNLAPDAIDRISRVFIWSRATGRIVVHMAGTNPSLSRDGRVVVFGVGSDMVLRDRDPDGNGVFDEPGVTDRVLGGGRITGTTPAVSADGRHVVFVLTQNVLDPQQGQWTPTAVLDVATGAHRVTSVSSDGVANDRGTTLPSISANGRFVAFYSQATTLVPDPRPWLGPDRLFLHDRDADEDGVFDEAGAITTEQADVDGPAVLGADGPASISADGERLLFQMRGTGDLLVRDRLSRGLRRVRVGSIYAGVGPAGAVLDATGRWLTFSELGKTSIVDLLVDIAAPTLTGAGPIRMLPDGTGRLPLTGHALEFPYVLVGSAPVHAVEDGHGRSATIAVAPSLVHAPTVTVRPWSGAPSSTLPLTTFTCTYGVTPLTLAVPAAGGTFTVNVSRNDTRCPIELDVPTASWLSVSAIDSVVTIDVEQHFGLDTREATVRVAQQDVGVRQTGGPSWPTITTLRPARGGNGGDVSLRLYGRGFGAGMGIRLRRSGFTDIVARTVRVREDGQIARGILDLRGQALGEWKVVLRLDGKEYVTSRMFVIETPRPPAFTCTIDAPATMTVGVKTTFLVSCVNVGNMDAPPTTVVIRPPIAEDVSVANSDPRPELGLPIPASIADQPVTVDVRGSTLLPIVIPTAGPEETVPITVSATPIKPGAFHIETWTTEVELIPPSSGAYLACQNSLANLLLDALGAVPGLGCGASAVTYFGGLIGDLGAYAQDITEPGGVPFVQSWVKLAGIAFTSGLDGSFGSLLSECVGRSVPVVAPLAAAYEVALSINDAVKDCRPLFRPPEVSRRTVRNVTIVPLTNDTCRAYWQPYSQHQFGGDGGTRLVVLDVGAGCPWDLTRSKPPSWLHVSPAKGTGPAAITLVIDRYTTTCTAYCDRFHDFVSDGLDGVNLGVKQLPGRVSPQLKYRMPGTPGVLTRLFFPGISAGLRVAASAVADSAAAAGATLTVNGTPVPFVMEDANTMLFSMPGVPANTPITIDAALADGRTLHEVLPNVAPTVSESADTDGDGMPDLWEIRYGLDPEAAADALRDNDGDGVANRTEYERGSHPLGTHVRYLAEGATGTFFDTRLALANPGVLPASVLLRFLDGQGVMRARTMHIAPRSRATVVAGEIPGLSESEFSLVVESDRLVVVDRTMTWQGPGGYGSHAETGVEAPSSTWYLAEGSTRAGFELFYLLQNPSAQASTVRVRFLRTESAPLEKLYTLPPNSRTNIWVNVEQFDGLGQALAEAEVSAVVEALDGTPLVVERAMYLSRGGRVFDAGHESAGVSQPSTDWFLAEGATGPYFDLFVLVANPNAQPVDVEFTYLLGDGTTYRRVQQAPANSRSTVWVDYEQFAGVAGYPLADVAVSTTVRSISGQPIIVERAMWWPGDFATWAEAHNSAGMTRTGVEWVLADGEVGGPAGAETYILMANTSAYAGQATVTLMFEDGTTAERLYALPPSARVNAAIAQDFGGEADGRRFSAIVTSIGDPAAALVVERAMYHNAGGVRWAAGSNAAGTRLRD